MVDALGRYEILEELGQGGFAIVYKGRDTALDRRVALKELRPLLLQDKNWVERFRREARTIARLDHPSIVPIYDVYEADDRLFIVMRLVDGLSLEDWLNQKGRLVWADVMTVISAITAGLSYAHRLGVLHRDIKPANILIDPERGPMLSDFGLAKIMGQHSLSMTESGSIVGTPHYIAPEVWEGKGTTARSDIYALGCVLYEMITGEKIFKGETPPAVMMAHFKPLSLPNDWPPDIPAGVAEVLQTALAQEPEERYASADEMREAVTALVSPDPGLPQIVAALLPDMPSDPDLTQTLPDAAHFEPQTAPETQAPAGPAKPQKSPSPRPVQATPAPPVEPAHRGRWRTTGCFWKGLLTMLGIFLILTIGTGSFCAAFGSSLGSNFGSPVEAVSGVFARNVQVGQTITESIQIPAPADIETVRLEIEILTGQLRLTPGAAGSLLTGTATYNVAQLKPEVTTSGSSIRVSHESEFSNAFMLLIYDLINNDLENSWDLRLGDSPMALTLSLGTTEGRIELGGASLVDLTVTQGAVSELDLSFSEPNQTEMQTFDFNAGPTRRATLTGLANARADNLNVNVAAGEYILEFTGQLQNDMTVRLTGNASAVTLIIPDGPAVRVSLPSDQIQVDAPEDWQQGRRQISKDGAGHTISIQVGLETGSIKLRAP